MDTKVTQGFLWKVPGIGDNGYDEMLGCVFILDHR